MRGKHIYDGCKIIVTRITPAGAGKTIFCCLTTLAEQDHPRRCGENMCKIIIDNFYIGSPPQVRGKPPTWEEGIPVRGITPAGAGKTFLRIHSEPHLQDHPRRCGENDECKQDRAFEVGSPPQVRGKLTMMTEDDNYFRITPAGAGKTCKMK